MMENMGRKLEALLGKSFSSAKMRHILDLVVSRVASLEKQHRDRCSQARSEVIHLLDLGHQESALLRVDHVIREQNVLDALAMIECYCQLLCDKASLIKNSKTCPDEAKEAISSLIFSASRYGQLPELHKIHKLFASKYGRQFVKSAIELRNNCGVNPKIAKKFPQRRASLGLRMKVLKEIASANGTVLKIEDEASENIKEEAEDGESSSDSSDHKLQNDNTRKANQKIKQDADFSSLLEQINAKTYSDAAAAANAAFELAIRAAAAARVAVELSPSRKPRQDDPDEHGRLLHQQKKTIDRGDLSKLVFEIDRDEAPIDDTKQSRSNELSDFDDFSFPVISPKATPKRKPQEIPISEKIFQSAASDLETERETERLLTLKISNRSSKPKLETVEGLDGENEEKKKGKKTFGFLMSKLTETRHSNEEKGDNNDEDENGTGADHNTSSYFPLESGGSDSNRCSGEDGTTESSTDQFQDAEQQSVAFVKRGRKPVSKKNRRGRRS